jgi:hypothetical protein
MMDVQIHCAPSATSVSTNTTLLHGGDMSTEAKYWRYRLREIHNDKWSLTDYPFLIERMDRAIWEVEELFTKNQVGTTEQAEGSYPPGPFTDSKSNVAACPFCKSTDPVFYPNDVAPAGRNMGTSGVDAFYGHCEGCGADGPVADSHFEAIEKWNICAQHTLYKDQYQKLRGWMSSNVQEGWKQVENLGAIACYVDWQEFDRYLHELPECNVGLMQKAPNATLPVQLLKHQSEMEDIRQLAEEAGVMPLPNEHVRKTTK